MKEFQISRRALMTCALFSGTASPGYAAAAPGTGGWQHLEVRRFKAAEANQGVAVDSEYFFAIDNHAIGKYRKATGERVSGWSGPDGGMLKHLNAGVVLAGRLYCAHSNYPDVPEQSSVEIWDTATMRHIDRHVFERPPGSLTWAVRRGDDWYACFAHYRTTSDPARSRVVRFDAEWKQQASWSFPAELVERFAGYSASGGDFGPEGKLFVAGHDARELYILELPPGSGEMNWRATLPISAAGQAFAWDRISRSGFYSIDRKSREVIVSEVRRSG